MEYNTGFYMDGTPWAIPLKEVRLKNNGPKRASHYIWLSRMGRPRIGWKSTN